VGAKRLLDFGAGRGKQSGNSGLWRRRELRRWHVDAAHQVVSKAATTTTVTSSINPSSAGKNVEFTAVVTAPFGGIATGTVTFYDGTTTLGTVATSGAKASLTTSKLSHGTPHVTATYNSSADFAGSSGSLTQTVN